MGHVLTPLADKNGGSLIASASGITTASIPRRTSLSLKMSQTPAGLRCKLTVEAASGSEPGAIEICKGTVLGLAAPPGQRSSCAVFVTRATN
jgi:hypothetical protein